MNFLPMRELIIATRNRDKRRELAALLGNDFRLADLSTYPELAEVAETGHSFEENARLKAITISRHLAGLVLADDSGLEVDSLGHAPGVFSARYAGPGANDAANRKKLGRALAELPPSASRVARFRCVLVLARKGKIIAEFDGTVEGKIVQAERGAAGFGYDPLFQPDGFEKTFAEMSSEEKNAISHRGRAVAKLREFLTAVDLAK